VGETACRGLSPRSPAFDSTHNSMYDLYLNLEKVSLLVLQSSATYSTNDRSSFIHYENCQEITEGVVQRQASSYLSTCTNSLKFRPTWELPCWFLGIKFIMTDVTKYV